MTFLLYFSFYFGLSAEVSDQNFEDEDQGEKSSCASMAKRLKTATAEGSSNDQVMIKNCYCHLAYLSHVHLRSCDCWRVVIIWSLTFVHSLM